jgi:hypothetical protein
VLSIKCFLDEANPSGVVSAIGNKHNIKNMQQINPVEQTKILVIANHAAD